jgi:RecB family endonuclease NucS
MVPCWFIAQSVEPVNWQPSTSALTVKADEESLEIYAVRQKPRETLRATFSSVLMVSAMSLNDSGDFLLHAAKMTCTEPFAKPDLLEEGFKPISWERRWNPDLLMYMARTKTANSWWGS